MTISKKVESIIAGSSFIRKMFEEGARLKKEFGAENVCDFSLGNPNVPPPEKFNEILRETVSTCGLDDHCYMPNTGYPLVCGSVAKYLAEEQQAPVTEKEILMTCGASGALNVALKAILDPGDEVLTPIPCFVEYKFYADNHGGVLKTGTPIRQKVLEILLQDHRALGAYDVLDRMREAGLSAQPPAAYRALDFLVENGFAHKIERVNAFVGCTHPQENHVPAFLICTRCHAVAEVPAEAAREQIARTARAAGFRVLRTMVEAEGICPNCAEAGLHK